MKRPHLLPRSLLGAASSTTHWLSTLGIVLVFLASTVRAQEPTITVEPQDQHVSLGGNVAFRLTASASAPAWYEWYHDDGVNQTSLFGTDSARAGSILTLNNVQLADAGGYYAVIINDLGRVTSRVAQLSIDPTFIKVKGQPIVDDVEPSEVGIWCDYNHDGFMDLFVGNSQNGPPVSTNSLYRNEGDGTFTRIINSLTSTALNT